jgi:serine/threonine protein kinase
MTVVAKVGLVHRDLAARNVLLCTVRPPVVRLADFGLALLFPAPAPTSAAVSDSEALKDEGVLGDEGRQDEGGEVIAVRWAPPEAMEAGAWGEASDVWAFGVLLWEVCMCACDLDHICAHVCMRLYLAK